MKIVVNLKEGYYSKDYGRTYKSTTPQKYNKFIKARKQKIKLIFKNKNGFNETLIYENGIISWEIQEIENGQKVSNT